MAPMSSIVVSTTGARTALEAVPPPAPSPVFDGEDLGSDFSVDRRKERLVRLPNHLKP